MGHQEEEEGQDDHHHHHHHHHGNRILDVFLGDLPAGATQLPVPNVEPFETGDVQVPWPVVSLESQHHRS